MLFVNQNSVMKTNSNLRGKPLHKGNIISLKLQGRWLNNLAKESGFVKRKAQKITPKHMIIGFMLMVSKIRNTYSDWAMEIGLLAGQCISKQALCERLLDPSTEEYLKKVLEGVIGKQIVYKPSQKESSILKHFNNIYIDDSTVISLPDELNVEFPGNVTKGKKKAQAKIHAMYNLTCNSFAFMSIYSFTNNDQSLSPNVLPYLQNGDLILRDLGFTTLNVLGKFNQKGIYFVCRKLYLIHLYEPETGALIDLVKLLSKKKIIDKEVVVGKEQQLKLRLVAVRVPAQKAETRIRKAKKHRDKRLNHSPEYYTLLQYNIFLSNIPEIICNTYQIYQIYRWRWQIEIIFKSWKSNFSLEKLFHWQCKNATRVKCTIYLMLLYIILFHVVWWYECGSHINNNKSKDHVSLLKLANLFNSHFYEILTSDNKAIHAQILKHCLYENRKDRENARASYSKFAF